MEDHILTNNYFLFFSKCRVYYWTDGHNDIGIYCMPHCQAACDLKQVVRMFEAHVYQTGGSTNWCHTGFVMVLAVIVRLLGVTCQSVV